MQIRPYSRPRQLHDVLILLFPAASACIIMPFDTSSLHPLPAGLVIIRPGSSEWDVDSIWKALMTVGFVALPIAPSAVGAACCMAGLCLAGLVDPQE